MHGSNAKRSSFAEGLDRELSSCVRSIVLVYGQFLQYSVKGIVCAEDAFEADPSVESIPICIYSLLSHAGQNCIVELFVCYEQLFFK